MDTDAWSFARRVAWLLHDSPDISCKRSVEVQYVEGFEWLHIEGLEIPPNINEVDHPAFKSETLETIWILCHTGSGSHAYCHFINGKLCRSINVSDGTVHDNSGFEESWEKPARDEKFARYSRWGDAADFSWPKAFEVDMVLKGLHLPSPWSGEDLEILDICIVVNNPDENDMSRALTDQTRPISQHLSKYQNSVFRARPALLSWSWLKLLFSKMWPR